MMASRFQLSLSSKGDTTMIYAIIALVLGVFIIVLAIICAFVMLRNSRLEREKAATRSEVEVVRANMKTLQAEKARAMADINTLGAENSRLREEHTDLFEALEKTRLLYNSILRERNELVARATALQEAMEARPTQPKRAVRKNTSTPQTTEEARQAEQAARYNAEMDERNRISAENRDKTWLPLHDGE